MAENEAMTLKLPQSELKSVDEKSIGQVRKLTDEQIKAMLPLEPEEETAGSGGPVAEEPKKKRGRKPKEEVQQANEAQAAQMVDDLKPIVQLGLEVICKRLPNPIPLSELELDSFTKAFDMVARKHFGKIAEHSAEVALLGASIFILVPRMIKVKKDEEPGPTPLGVLEHAAVPSPK